MVYSELGTKGVPFWKYFDQWNVFLEIFDENAFLYSFYSIYMIHNKISIKKFQLLNSILYFPSSYPYVYNICS